MPRPDLRRRERAEPAVTQVGLDVEAEQATVELAGPRAQLGPVLEPPGGVLRQSDLGQRRVPPRPVADRRARAVEELLRFSLRPEGLAPESTTGIPIAGLVAARRLLADAGHVPPLPLSRRPVPKPRRIAAFDLRMTHALGVLDGVRPWPCAPCDRRTHGGPSFPVSPSAIDTLCCSSQASMSAGSNRT